MGLWSTAVTISPPRTAKHTGMGRGVPLGAVVTSTARRAASSTAPGPGGTSASVRQIPDAIPPSLHAPSGEDECGSAPTPQGQWGGKLSLRGKGLRNLDRLEGNDPLFSAAGQDDEAGCCVWSRSDGLQESRRRAERMRGVSGAVPHRDPGPQAGLPPGLRVESGGIDPLSHRKLYSPRSSAGAKGLSMAPPDASGFCSNHCALSTV